MGVQVQHLVEEATDIKTAQAGIKATVGEMGTSQQLGAKLKRLANCTTEGT